MRLWSIHPRYLDGKGLVALWREALLARAVLLGKTKGYNNHPQLHRFREHDDPLGAIDSYLWAVLAESVRRGYAFDPTKLRPNSAVRSIAVTSGQLDYEWHHLSKKLKSRSPAAIMELQSELPEPHPLFVVVAGNVEPWEKAH